MISRFDEAVKSAAKKVVTDEIQSEFFIKGAKWVIETMVHDIYHNHHPMASDSDNAYLDKLTLRDIKAFIKKMRELTPAPNIEK